MASIVWTMMAHVGFGLIAILLGAVLWADLREMRPEKIRRVRLCADWTAATLVLSYLVGAHWYVMHYGEVKAAIKAGPWPWAHGFFMEAKEHLFFFLLAAAFYLVAVVRTRLFESEREFDRLARNLAAWIVLWGLAMEGFGAMISMGYRIAVEAGS